MSPFSLAWHDWHFKLPSSEAWARESGPGETCARAGVASATSASIATTGHATIVACLRTGMRLFAQRDVLLHDANADLLEERVGRIAADADHDHVVGQELGLSLHVQHHGA